MANLGEDGASSWLEATERLETHIAGTRTLPCGCRIYRPTCVLGVLSEREWEEAIANHICYHGDPTKHDIAPFYWQSAYWNDACSLAKSNGLTPGTREFNICVQRTINTWWFDEIEVRL